MSWEFTGKIKDLSIGFRDGEAVLTAVINETDAIQECFDELNGADKLRFKIDKYRKKRSLDANAYFWVLVGLLAARTGATRDEIYRNAIRDIGGNYDVVCVRSKAADRLRESWMRNGLGWVTDAEPSKIGGCVNVTLYYGSSTYDAEQMARLIDNVVQDCKAVGIQTETPEQIAGMLSRWSEYEKRHTGRA